MTHEPSLKSGGLVEVWEVARIDGKKTKAGNSSRRAPPKDREPYMSRCSQAAQQFIDRARTRVKEDIALQLRVPMIAREKVMAGQYHTGAIYGSQNQQRGMSPPPPEKALQDHIDFLTREIERMRQEKKTDEVEYLTSLRNLLEQDKGRVNAIPTFGMFFGGGVQTSDDLVDFLVWKWEADRRKIVLTPETVKKLISYETLGEDTEAFSQRVVEALGKSYRNFKPAELLDSLTDEFRVRIARGLVLGDTDGMAASRPNPRRTNCASTTTISNASRSASHYCPWTWTPSVVQAL